jgi:7,8-dihydropterin-6-yl-methyl-4-(beta-D-ribofuranosyl)aminobenzene 5'-phosphate synthase
VTITVLAENHVSRFGLKGEHGLCLHVESDGKSLLLDTGQSDLFLANAAVLGIDITAVDVLVLSHGHYDHTGGLEPFCRVNKKAVIHAGRDLFVPKYRKDGSFIGTADNRDLYRDRLRTVTGLTEVHPGVRILADVPVVDPEDTHFRNLYTGTGDARREDTFSEELSLLIDTDEGLVLLSGCSHRGITNIVRAARTASGKPVKLVFGGFHFSGETETAIRRLLEELVRLVAGEVGVCHCTGINGWPLVKEYFGNKAFYAHTGIIKTIGR